MSLDKNITVLLFPPAQVAPVNLKPLHGYITCPTIKCDTSSSCRTLISQVVPTVARRDMHVKLSPYAITEPVLDLKSISDTVLLEIWVQLAKLKVRYHLMNYAS